VRDKAWRQGGEQRLGDDNGGLFSDNAMIKADSVLYRPVNGEIRLQDG